MCTFIIINGAEDKIPYPKPEDQEFHFIGSCTSLVPYTCTLTAPYRFLNQHQLIT